MIKSALTVSVLIFFVGLSAPAQNKFQGTRRPIKKAAPSTPPDYNYSPPPPAEPIAVPAPPPSKHFYVAAIYSSANAIKYKGSADLYGSPTPFTATESTTGAFGVAGGYLSREAGKFGYSGELAFELPRTSSGVEGKLGTQGVHGTYDDNPSNSVLTLAANGNYSLNSRIYFFAGINYPFASGSGDSLKGLPGYQAGGGYGFSQNLSGELGYRVLRLKGTIEGTGFNLNVDEATFSGVIMSVQFLF